MPEQQDFQIPQQLRELAEKNLEQARVAYGKFLDGMAEAVRAWSTVPSAVITSGLKGVQERAIQFAKENGEAGFALASDLAKAKDLQDVLRLQSNFAQVQMQSYARQAQELGRLMVEATRSSKQGLNAPIVAGAGSWPASSFAESRS
jgi:phasin